MKMNEETLKSNVVVPLLQSIGIDSEGLSFETQFSIQLGRGVYTVKGERVSLATGRSDILCSLNDKPLFIIEVKGEEQTLTDADRRQGLSYARLLDPMAPFVLLTNGHTSKLFDTYSGIEIQPFEEQALLKGYTADLTNEMRLRHEALSHFIGYSYENLCHYCRCHNEVALKPFISDELEGSASQVTKKYLPKAYIARSQMEMAFQTFIWTSGPSVFPIIGDSGVGKTNVLCHVVHSNPMKPFLFYSGSFLSHSIIQDIANDFNIIFSPQEQGASVLRKVSALTQAYGESFVLFLDAIDEWDAPDKLAQLNQLAEWFSQLGLKLVVSCKTQLWQRFTLKKGVPTPLAEHLFLDAPILEEYSTDELNKAVKEYSAFFCVDVENNNNYPVSLNPFALRVAFEVSHATNAPINLSNPTRLTLTKYLNLRLIASDDPEKALRFLVEISGSLLNRDQNQILETDIRSDLGLRLDESIPPELFYLDLLYRHTDDLGKIHIGFYFTTLRDHLIVTHVLRLAEDQLSLPTATVDGLLTKYIGESALGYFFRTGNKNNQSLCLQVATEALTRGEFNILPRLLSWQGTWLRSDLADDWRDDILAGLLSCFKASADNIVLAEQILDGIECIQGQRAEVFFADLFEVLLCRPGKPFEMVSYRIARYLSEGSDIEVTNRLVDMARHAVPDTGYIRRYIVESLEKRGGFDRKETFLSLIVDPDANVRTWVCGWYCTVEDVALRDQLLEMLDVDQNLNVADDLVTALGKSQLKDTAELIYQRLINGNIKGSVLKWVYRALAILGFSKAVPYLMQTVKSSPTSDLAGHALIALGDLRAKETMPLLYDLVQSGEMGLKENEHWLTYAFHHVAEEQDYAALSDVVQKRLNSASANLAAIILAGTGNRCWDQLVFGYVLDENVSVALRSRVFHEWSNALTQSKSHQYNAPIFNSADIVTVHPDITKQLHTMFTRNDEMSSLALLVLINTSSDIKRVAEHVMLQFEDLISDFNLRTILLYRHEQWTDLGKLIRPWLHRHIEQANLASQYTGNWFELLRAIADHSTVELLNRNRQRYNPLFGKHLVDALENRIRKGLASSPMGDI